MRKLVKIHSNSDSVYEEVIFEFEDKIFHNAVFKRGIVFRQIVRILKELHDDIAYDLNLLCDKGEEIINAKKETEELEKEIKELILKLW